MFFHLSKIVWWFIEPSNAVAIAIAAALLLLLWGRRKSAIIVLSCVVAFLAAVTILPLPALVIAPLEQRFQRPAPMPPKVDGIILLGGAQVPRMTKEHGTPALNGGAGTVLTFMRLGRLYPEAKMIFTGGAPSIFGVVPSEVETLRLFLQQQGFDENRVIYEGEARNTHENAVLAKAMAAPKPGEVWLLVTQAMHMPRSIGVFRRAEWDVVAFPDVYRAPRSLQFRPVPSTGDALALFGAGLREWTGLTAYYATGRSSALFPRP